MTLDKITYGRAGEQCVFTKSTRNHDLYPRESKPRLTIDVQESNTDSITVSTKSTALVIVDMMNLFLDPSLMNHTAGRRLIGPIIKVIERCRELGIQVIWLNWSFTDDDLASAPATLFRACFNFATTTQNGMPPWHGIGSDLGGSKGRAFMTGSWNADIHPELKQHASASDIHCAKQCDSGSWDSELPLRKTLVEHQISTLLFVGLNTDQCVMSTVTPLTFAGYNCVLLEDCCAGASEESHRAAVKNIQGPYGFLTNSDCFVAGKVEKSRHDENR